MEDITNDLSTFRFICSWQCNTTGATMFALALGILLGFGIISFKIAVFLLIVYLLTH